MSEMPIEVIRSARRRKTVQAYLHEGKLRVMIPDHLTADQEAEVVDKLAAKLARRTSTTQIDLDQRSRILAERYQLPLPVSIEWSDRQLRRWGSCSPSSGRIRVSNRLATVPDWVLDSVLVHELAHLVIADHGKDFRSLVDRYPRTERATGYLMALSDQTSIGE